MSEFVAILTAHLAVALIESDGFMAVARHAFEAIMRCLLN
jgi:hypothetical protein